METVDYVWASVGENCKQFFCSSFQSNIGYTYVAFSAPNGSVASLAGFLQGDLKSFFNKEDSSRNK